MNDPDEHTEVFVCVPSGCADKVAFEVYDLETEQRAIVVTRWIRRSNESRDASARAIAWHDRRRRNEAAM